MLVENNAVSLSNTLVSAEEGLCTRRRASDKEGTLGIAKRPFRAYLTRREPDNEYIGTTSAGPTTYIPESLGTYICLVNPPEGT